MLLFSFIYFLFCTAGIIPYFLLFVNSYFDIFFSNLFATPPHGRWHFRGFTKMIFNLFTSINIPTYTVDDVLLMSAKRSSMSFQSTSPYTVDDICHIMSNKFHKQLLIVNFRKDKYFSFLYRSQEEYLPQGIYKSVQQ